MCYQVLQLLMLFQKFQMNLIANQTKYGQAKQWLKDSNIEMYLTHNEEKSDVAERFTRTLNNKIYKYMTSILKN